MLVLIQVYYTYTRTIYRKKKEEKKKVYIHLSTIPLPYAGFTPL